MSQDPTIFTNSYSFSCWAMNNIDRWCHKDEEITSNAKQFLKLSITETTLAALFPIAVIETIVQSIISLLVKTVHFFIPEKHAEGFTETVYKKTVSGTSGSFSTIISTPYRINANIAGFINTEKSNEFLLITHKGFSVIADLYKRGFEATQGFRNAHIC